MTFCTSNTIKDYFSAATSAAGQKNLVVATPDQYCEKLHKSLRALTTELITNMRIQRDMAERTTQALESMAKNQESIARFELHLLHFKLKYSVENGNNIELFLMTMFNTSTIKIKYSI